MDRRFRSRKPMRWPIVMGAVVATLALTTDVAADSRCGPLAHEQMDGWSGFQVSTREGATTVSFEPWQPNSPGRGRGEPSPHFTLKGIVEVLGREAQILPVIVDPFVCPAVDSRTSWTGETALDVLQKLLNACGQRLVIQDGFGIVGEQRVDGTAVVISIGPVAGDPLPPAAELALYRDLPVHDFNLLEVYDDHALYTVRVGYLPTPEDPNELIVFAGNGESMLGRDYRVFRSRLARGEDLAAECQWRAWGGRPVLPFSEDIDGDGVQDVVIDRRDQQISARDEVVPSTIVSGRTGEALLSFIGQWMAIQRTEEGRVRISAATKEGLIAGEACLPVFELSQTTGVYERVDGSGGGDRRSLACTHPAARLAATWNGPDTITLYDFHRYAFGQRPDDSITGHESRVVQAAVTWTFTNPLRYTGAAVEIQELPGSRVLLAYVPAAYVEAVRSIGRR